MRFQNIISKLASPTGTRERRTQKRNGKVSCNFTIDCFKLSTHPLPRLTVLMRCRKPIAGKRQLLKQKSWNSTTISSTLCCLANYTLTWIKQEREQISRKRTHWRRPNLTKKL